MLHYAVLLTEENILKVCFLMIDRSVMPSEDVDAHGTEGATRHRKNTNKQSNCDSSNASAYTEEQYEAVQRYRV